MTLRGGIARMSEARRSARIKRSAHYFQRLVAAIPAEVPTRRDITWLELHRIAPAILIEGENSRVVERFMVAAEQAPSRFAFVTGLLVARNPIRHTRSGLEALALSLCSIRYGLFGPSAALLNLLRACENLEWDDLPSQLALVALTKAFRLRRSMALWRRCLGALAAAERWEEICTNMRRNPLHSHLARNALSLELRPRDSERVLAAELITLARCHIGDPSRELARRWLLPLVSRSTERFMKRTFAARRLTEQLDDQSHVGPGELAAAIEGGITPNTGDDYSNFRAAFSPATWEHLHPCFHNWAIFTELERFACEHDRCRFWRYIESKGAIK